MKFDYISCDYQRAPFTLKLMHHSGRFLCWFVLLLFTTRENAFSWDQHQTLMKVMLDSPLSSSRSYLQQKISIPTAQQQKEEIAKIAVELAIDGSKVPIFEAATKTLTMSELLQSRFIDEPDFGMDQNLPDSADPKNERAHMGGKTGPTSQGFRHMYFAGLEWSSPFATFQLPMKAVGQAPEHYQKMRNLSDRYFKEQNLFWGIRTLLWSLHIVQDLHQPFHVTQVPDLRMLPFKNLFSGFVQRSTQTIANEHFAYEGLMLELTKEAKVNGFETCFETVAPTPVDEIKEIVRIARTQSPVLGSALYRLFGASLKNPEIDLPNEKGSLDYYALLHASAMGADEAKGLEETKKVTCELMKSLAAYTWGELDRVNSINTGK